MMISVVLSAVVNTILRRIALVPLAHYPYFLTQVQTLVYVVFYCSMLYYRRRRGIVTAAMLQIRKQPFLWIGFWDSLGDLLGNLGTSRLPGYQVPLLAKLNIVFTALFSQILLGKRYSQSQILSMGVVITGSIVTLIPQLLAAATSTTTSSSDEKATSSSSVSDLFYALIYVSSVAPTALAFVLKEQVFRESQHLNLDIFVVNSFGSIVGLCFTVLLLPIASVPGLGKVPLSQLPEYMLHGLQCFTGANGTDQDNCTGSPLAPLLYLGVNVLYNIFFLNLIKHGGALLTFVTNTVTFPLSTILFTLPWPLLGSSQLNGYILLGLVVELTGILLYRQASVQVSEKEKVDAPDETASMVESTDSQATKRYGSVENIPLNNNTSLSDQDYNDWMERLRECRKYNSEEVCKSLLSNKCNCG